MMFFPYRVDVNLQRLPWMTLLVCAICIYVFLQQLKSHEQYVKSVNYFCEHSIKRATQLVLRRLNSAEQNTSCAAVFISIRDADNPEIRIDELVSLERGPKLFKNPQDQKHYIHQRLKNAYADFETLVPVNLTEEYAYHPLELQLTQMFTSIMSHGSWTHLIFNLLFFFAFAASVEIVIGPLIYPFAVMVMAISTNLTYTLLADNSSLPTVGLSGIVMGMMAMLSVTVPTLRIRCLLWIVLYIKVLRIPAWFLALWYIGMDIYNVQTDFTSNTNYIAHISGAATGACLGLIYWATRPNYLRGLVSDS